MGRERRRGRGRGRRRGGNEFCLWLRMCRLDLNVGIGELDANDDDDLLRVLKCLHDAKRLFDCSIAQSMQCRTI